MEYEGVPDPKMFLTGAKEQHGRRGEEVNFETDNPFIDSK